MQLELTPIQAVAVAAALASAMESHVLEFGRELADEQVQLTEYLMNYMTRHGLGAADDWRQWPLIYKAIVEMLDEQEGKTSGGAR